MGALPNARASWQPCRKYLTIKYPQYQLPQNVDTDICEILASRRARYDLPIANVRYTELYQSPATAAVN